MIGIGVGQPFDGEPGEIITGLVESFHRMFGPHFWVHVSNDQAKGGYFMFAMAPTITINGEPIKQPEDVSRFIASNPVGVTLTFPGKITDPVTVANFGIVENP